jgi:putative ABC transport system ATP-binding protein
MANAAIQAVGLTKWFGEGETRTVAVRDVTFDAYYNEMLLIVGPSGSGKTTLLSMISGILRPNEGSVRLENRDVWSLPENRIADLRLNTVGFVFQDYHLFPRLTTAENVAVPLILKRQPWNEAVETARHYLDVVGLAKRADLPPNKLSGGEQQRVAIARAIASGPDILVFDEPTASLDGDTGRKIIEFAKKEVLNEKRCIIVVTHDDRIFEYSDRIVKMEDGHIIGIEKGSGHA